MKPDNTRIIDLLAYIRHLQKESEEHIHNPKDGVNVDYHLRRYSKTRFLIHHLENWIAEFFV